MKGLDVGPPIHHVLGIAPLKWNAERMRPVIVFLAAILLPLPAAAQDELGALPEETLTADPRRQRTDRVERWLGALDTLRAGFVQVAPDGTASEGELSLDRPGKLRFEFTDGTPLLLVSDGDILTFVDYSIGQVTRWPIEDTVLGLLVREDIDLEAAGAVINTRDFGSGEELVVTARDPERPEQGLLSLEFAERADGLELIGWQVIDARGQATRVTLQDQRLNIALADDLWTFEDPRKLPSQRRRRSR